MMNVPNGSCGLGATDQQDPDVSLSTDVTFDQRSHSIPAASAANPPHEQEYCALSITFFSIGTFESTVLSVLLFYPFVSLIIYRNLLSNLS